MKRNDYDYGQPNNWKEINNECDVNEKSFAHQININFVWPIN